MVADLPYKKVYETREKNRRLGLGLMGLHEWLIQRGSKYEVTPELHKWLYIYQTQSDLTAKTFVTSFQSVHLFVKEQSLRQELLAL